MKNFLANLNLQEYVTIFEEEEIDLEILLELTEDDLRELVPKLGPRKKILNALKASAQVMAEQSSSQRQTIHPKDLDPNNMVTYLAHPWDEYLKETHPSVKLHWLTDTAEVAVRWVCALLLAEIRYANDNALPQEIQQKFKENIARPTLGVWLNLVDELSKRTIDNPQLKDIFEFYGKELNINGLFPDKGDDKTSLLQLRNRIAHGGGTTKKQSEIYLEIYNPVLEKLLKSLTSLMGDAKLYGGYKDKCHLLQGLTSKEEECEQSIEGPYMVVNETKLLLWPLVEFDVVRQITENGSIKESSTLTPQTYSRTDKQGVRYVPMGVEDSYSIAKRQEEFETVFALNKKTRDKSTLKRHEYRHDDFLFEARYIKEELIGRIDEIATIKKWIQAVDGFDDELDCRFIYGGPGLGKSTLMASVAYNMSNHKKHHTFYYRFRGGDARNNKHSFVKLLRDSLVSWKALSEINEKATDSLMDVDETLKDINIRLEKIKELETFTQRDGETKEEVEVRPMFRLFVDGLDEVLANDPSVLTLLESLQTKGVVTLIATRLENGAEKLHNSSWIEPMPFKDGVNGLPLMSDDDVRAMLLDGISKAQRKELIENDTENEDMMTNPMVQAIAKKAAGLPLYVHLLINDLQNSQYSMTDGKLPDGLNDYYNKLIDRMGISSIKEYTTKVIALLSLTSEPIDVEAISLTLVVNISDAKDYETLIRDVLLASGSLLKQALTPEETIGYTLYHQSFRDFTLKGEDDSRHPLFYTLKDMKTAINAKIAQWKELPDSNLKNHLFRYGNLYSLAWRKDGLEIVRERLSNLEYLLKRAQSLRATELGGLLAEYELVQKKLPKDEQKEFNVWSSFFRENIHLIGKVDESTWRPSQSFFQLAYEDGNNSPLTRQAQRLLKEKKIDFVWLKNSFRPEEFRRTGLVKALDITQPEFPLSNRILELKNGDFLCYGAEMARYDVAGKKLVRFSGREERHIAGAIELRSGNILSCSTDKTLRIWSGDAKEVAVMRGNFGSSVEAMELANGTILSYSSGTDFDGSSCDYALRIWSADGEELATMRGHTNYVNKVTQLSNGTILSFVMGMQKSGGPQDYTLRLWRDDGALIAVLDEHAHAIRGAMELHGGNILSYSTDLRVWSHEGILLNTISDYRGLLPLKNGDVLTYVLGRKSIRRHAITDDSLARARQCGINLLSTDGSALGKMDINADSINGVIQLDNGNLLAYSKEGTLEFFDANFNTLNYSVDLEDNSEIYNAIETRNGNILTFSHSKNITVWSANGTILGKVQGHTSSPNALELKNGTFLSYSVNRMIPDGALRLFDEKGNVLALVTLPSGVASVRELQNGNVLTMEYGGSMKIWDLRYERNATKEGHRGIWGTLKTLNGSYLTCSPDTTVRIWNENGEEEAVFKAHSGGVRRAVELDNGNIVSLDQEGNLLWWERQYLSVVASHTISGRNGDLFKLKNGNVLAYRNAASRAEVKLFSESAEELAVFEGDRYRKVRKVVLLKSGYVLIHVKDDEDGSIMILWDERGVDIGEFQVDGDVNGIIEFNNGDMGFVLDEGSVQIWSLQRAQIAEIEVDHEKPFSVIELENGDILSFSDGHTLRRWDRQGKKVTRFEGRGEAVEWAWELRNGEIVSCAENGTLILWDVQGQVMARFSGHSNSVINLIELADGKIMSYSRDQTMRIWKRDGTLLQTLYTTKEISGIRFDIDKEPGNIFVISNEKPNVYKIQSSNNEIDVNALCAKFRIT